MMEEQFDSGPYPSPLVLSADGQGLGGVMGELVRSKDWSETPLGPLENWSYTLKTAVSFTLNAAFPFILAWGEAGNVIYNDRYIPIMGQRHPSTLGAPVAEVCKESIHVVGPMFEKAREGTAVSCEDGLLQVNRNGYLEEAYFSWSYSPIRNPDASIAGVLAPTQETTHRVLRHRRLTLLRDVASGTADVASQHAACQIFSDIVAKNNADITFALIYLIDSTGKRLELAGRAVLAEDHPASVPSIQLSEHAATAAAWPVEQVLGERCAVEVTGLEERFGFIPSGCQLPTSNAICLPLDGPSHESIGVVVFGVNPRRKLDPEYGDFLDLARSQLSSAIFRGRCVMEERRRLETFAEIDRAKSVFFSNVSHEYRTPLTLILGPVAELLADDSLSTKQREHVRMIERNAQRLYKLVNAVLDFSKLEAGRMDARFRLTDISLVTAHTASMFRSTMEKGGLQFVVDTPALGELVYLDVDMWEKIVLNLLSNAFKSCRHGKVTVRIYKTETDVLLEVDDTGCGIAEGEMDRLFERFHRCHSSYGRSVEGTGIGLSLTNEYVRLHGGEIRVESKVNVGTKFVVSIPFGKGHLPLENIISDAPEGLPTQDRRGSKSSSEGRAIVQESLRWVREDASLLDENGDTSMQPTSLSNLSASSDYSIGMEDPALPLVLLADDNADMREYVGGLLAKFCTVNVVSDGLQAYQSAIDDPPDLIISDVMMGGLTGFELLEKVKADGRTQSIPVILLSARAGEEAKVEGLRSGADDYLAKPFSAKELRARVRTQLTIGKMRADLEEQVKRRTNELENLTRQYKMLVSLSPVGIAKMNMKGEFTFHSETWWRVVGRDSALDNPDDWAKWMADGSKSVTAAEMAEILETRKSMRSEAELIRRDNGEHIWVMSTFVFRRFSEDGISSSDKDDGEFYIAVCDITKEKKLELEKLDAIQNLAEEQKRRAEEAEENKRQQEEFVDSVCHEIRNPLNGVISNADLLQAGLKNRMVIITRMSSAINTWRNMVSQLNVDSITTTAYDMSSFLEYLEAEALPVVRSQLQEDAEAIEAVQMCAAHQAVITDDVLQMSTLQKGKVALNPVICAPEIVIARVMKMFRSELVKKEIIWETLIITPTGNERHVRKLGELAVSVALATFVWVDPDRVAQVLFNCISNAIKFLAKSVNEKRLTVSLEFIQPKSKTEETGDFVTMKVSVRDSGIGMTESERQKLFARFSQATHRTYSTYGGSGLGLHICRNLVSAMGGHIDLTSAKGVGTEIFFEIPCQKPDHERLSEIRQGLGRGFKNPLNCASSEDESSLDSPFSQMTELWLRRRLVADGNSDSLPNVNEVNEITVDSATLTETSTKFADLNPLTMTLAPLPATIEQNGVHTQPCRPLRLEDIHVLIVEDNIINQKALKRQLEIATVKVDVANNGVEAIAKYQENFYHVLIMDNEASLCRVSNRIMWALINRIHRCQ
ncbi:uncharacterized protein EV422DRAFT_537600 [Fimicolochytrium jonesii]|uniref:uncharacterized protein n=1 Tax=Fimicolochytrium jonesii TaxID=1396493 RepID=UPI0022FDB911|nr:uncharacterized protein EV422DRAFT_537600 [Fimicolochytrium jonesii]KAI8818588.1 hypothetical protein EV422DRAFT_537600 [Fimicolochytrium jonesii]